MSDALTALTGEHDCTFSLSSELIWVTHEIYVQDAILMLTLETVKYMLTPRATTELHI